MMMTGLCKIYSEKVRYIAYLIGTSVSKLYQDLSAKQAIINKNLPFER